jgi:hypothetical protein
VTSASIISFINNLFKKRKNGEIVNKLKKIRRKMKKDNIPEDKKRR